MIGSGWLCMVLYHKFETEWVEAYEPGLGTAEIEIQECQRCGYRVPTGRDRPVDDRQS